MRMEMRMVSGHLDQLPAHSVLHLKHVEEGVDQVLVNLGIRNIIIVLQLIGNSTCHWPRGGACLVVSGWQVKTKCWHFKLVKYEWESVHLVKNKKKTWSRMMQEEEQFQSLKLTPHILMTPTQNSWTCLERLNIHRWTYLDKLKIKPWICMEKAKIHS